MIKYAQYKIDIFIVSNSDGIQGFIHVVWIKKKVFKIGVVGIFAFLYVYSNKFHVIFIF